ncbi:M28 family peptidase [Hymenobacter sp.]|uniref:M28 family peptidase n=1 Tax=Hymenobacter sp. TaxID=1898978 RepID=UPI00286AFF96|nr:M28 family peptidase [Hymenobacter sp.]
MNFHTLRLPLAALAGLVLLTGCPDKKPAETADPAAPAEARLPRAPVFNADSAYAFTARQVAFGPRVPNSKAHVATGDYLVATLKGYGLRVLEQPFAAMTFDGTNIRARNIIAQYQPQAARRVAIFGHWDTRPFADNDPVKKNAPLDGASDGASAVAVALEMARVLSQQPDSLAPNVGVDFIFFDAEDWGYDAGTQATLKNQLDGAGDSWCLGSQYWAKNLLPANYKAEYGVLLDMVGARGGKFSREALSREKARFAVDKIWNTAARLGYTDYFLFNDSGGASDDHVYTNQAGIPTVDIIDHLPNNPEQYFPNYHHATTDNMAVIDRKTLKAVGQTVLQTLYVD